MNASYKFNQHTRYLRSVCRVLGFDVFDVDWKMSFRSYVTVFLCGQYFLWMVYSIVIASDTFELLKSLSFIGFFFQSSLKIYFTAKNAAKYAFNFTSLREFIYDGQRNATEDRQFVIERIITHVLNLTKATTFLYVSSVFIFSLYPAYMYFVVDVKVTIFPLYIPWIDIYSSYGYGITNALHVLIATYGMFGALSSDTAFMMYVLHFVIYADLFKIECEQFQRDLTQVNVRLGSHEEEYRLFCRMRMRVIYKYHQDVINYLGSLHSCYSSICTVQVTTCSFSIMFNLFLALTTEWYATYSFICVSLFQLFVFSLLGTVIQLMNDRLISDVSNLPWYMLSSNEQKRFCFMLRRSQVASELIIPSLGPLNMETFTNIMQKIYSAFAMMYSFLADLG